VGDRQGIAGSLFERSLLALTAGDWMRGKELAEEELTLARSIVSTLHERYAVRELEVAASGAATQESAWVPTTSPAAAPTFLIALFYFVFGFDEISVQYPREL
jgi:hypothetical protein